MKVEDFPRTIPETSQRDLNPNILGRTGLKARLYYNGSSGKTVDVKIVGLNSGEERLYCIVDGVEINSEPTKKSGRKNNNEWAKFVSLPVGCISRYEPRSP